MVNNGRDGHQAAVRLDPDQAEAVGDEDDVSVVADGQARWTDQADWTDHPLGADPAFADGLVELMGIAVAADGTVTVAEADGSARPASRRRDAA